MTENEISKIIIGAAIEVHRALGPGLLESAYQECLAYEIKECGLSVAKEVKMPISFKEVVIDHGYRMDLLIEEKVVLELNLLYILGIRRGTIMVGYPG